MILNQVKTKLMIFNILNNYQFSTRLCLNDINLEIVKQAKLLGVIVTDDLRWDENTSYIMKKAYARMELLRKIAEFGASIEEKKSIYYLYVRSVLEQACVVWSSGLSMENIEDLKRVQKSSVEILLGNKYED